MKPIFWWLVRCCLWLLAFPVTAQQPARPLEWFAGDWDIRYRDEQLGEIRGLARVRVESDGAVLIRYLVTDPRNGSTHELTPFHIFHQDGTVTMDLPPGGPVAALDEEGRPAPVVAGENRLAIPDGIRLRASLGSQRAEVAINGSAKLGTSLRLVRAGDRLEGEWMVRRDRGSGFRGGRSGKRGTFTTVLPAPIGEVREEVMRGPETWESARLVVERVYRNRWEEDPATPGESAGRAVVSYHGKYIPEAARRAVRFADPALQADNRAEWGGGAVQVNKRAVPGPKTFVMKDTQTSQEALGVWDFDFPNLPAKSIHFARRTAGGDFEPTSLLYLGELFFLEAELARPSPGDARRYALLANANDPAFFHLQRDSRQPAKFRAGPFLLLGPEEEAVAGAVDAPPLAVNSTAVSAPTAARPFIIRAANGSRIQAGPAGGNLGEPMDFAVAEAKEDHSEDGPYQRALRRAEEFRRTHPDPDRYNISKFTPLSGSRRTHVTVQDHAALILLHGELLRNLDTARRQYTRKLSAKERRDLAKILMDASRDKLDLPIFYYDVAAPNGQGTMRLNVATYPSTLQESFGNDTAKRDAYLDRAIEEAAAKLVDHSALGAARIAEADLSRPESLLPAIKAGYDSAAASLKSRLVRRARPANGEPAVPRWVPDETGRAAVRGVPDLLGAIQADKELATYQWNMLQMITMPAAPFAGGAGLVARFGLAAVNIGSVAENLVELDAALKARDTGWDSAPVAGYDAYRAARDEVEARKIMAAMDLGMTAVGEIAARLTAAGIKPSKQGAQAAVARAAESGVESLSDMERAQFVLTLDSAMRKAADGGAASLTDVERTALRSQFPDGIPAKLAEELKLPAGDSNFVIDLGDSTMAGALRKPFLAQDPLPPRPAPVAPEVSPSSWIRRLHQENLEAARLGTPGARARLERIQGSAAMWEQLSPAARGRVDEGFEILKRLRSENPAVAALDETEALHYFHHHAGAFYGNRSITPEELAAEFLRFKNRPVSPQQLARAANISELNAEAAVLAAEKRLWSDADLAAWREPSPRPSPAPRRVTAGQETVDIPQGPAADPATAARESEIAGLLERVGLSRMDAEVAAMVPAGRSGDPRIGAAYAAMHRGVGAKKLQEGLGLTPAELRAGLDDYLRRFSPSSDAERNRTLDQFFDENLTRAEPRRRLDPSGTDANLPRGLAPRAVSQLAGSNEVALALEKMGVSKQELGKLTPEQLLPPGAGGDPRAGAAILAQKLDVPAPRAASALGLSESEYAGLLDRAAAHAQPNLTPSQRAAAVAADLRAGGVPQPMGSVLAARQNQIDSALRDLGISRGDPSLIRAGLEPESAVVGQALERGVPAPEIAARRNLTPERVEELADDYLRDARAIADPAERARRRTELLRDRSNEPGPDAPTVRLSPRVLALENEIADALERVGVDPVVAGERAERLVKTAQRDAHEAIIGGAWQSRVPPAVLRDQFGYSNEQIARGLDAFLENHIGMRDPATRAAFIAREYFTRHGIPLDSATVRAMANRAPPARQPLRAGAAGPPRDPPPPPPVAPPAPPLPPQDLNQRFGLPAPPSGPRPGELTASGAWRGNTRILEIQPGKPLRLNHQVRYLWLVDEGGRLLAAPEQFIVENQRPLMIDGHPLRMGHPTIIRGGLARIAGELQYFEGRGWVLNNDSGRYSWMKRDLRREHLENVGAALRENGLRVQVDFLE